MIYVNDLTKIYDNGALGVKDLNFHITKGEFVFVVGSSGSGKSTLMRLILKEVDPTSGEIFVNSSNLAELKRKHLPYFRRKVGVVFQDFRLLPNKTVYENVAFAMEIAETSARKIRRVVPSVLALVGLNKKAKAYPDQLSGGEKQRTSLARAIANNPPVLIADEPTGNLDPTTAWEIISLLDEINSTGTTVVVATHAHEIVDAMQKRVISLKGGQVIRDVGKGGYDNED